jgi:hypothetical protein
MARHRRSLRDAASASRQAAPAARTFFAGRAAFVTSVLLFAFAAGLTLARMSGLSRSAGDVNADWAMVDFRSSVYYPALAFLQGNNPYDPHVFRAQYPTTDAFPLYLPAVLLLHAPLALVSYPGAVVIFYVLTLALTLVTALVALRMSGVERSAALALFVASVMVLSRPGHMNILAGQDTLVYVLGTYLALWAAERSPVVSGAGLLLACLKPTFGVPLAVLMLAQGYVRAVVFGGAMAAGLSLPPLLILARDAGGFATFKDTMVANFLAFRSDPTVNPSLSVLSIDVSGVVGRVLGRPPGLVWEVVMAVVLLVAAATALRVLGKSRDTWALRVTIVCLTILGTFHHQPYDLLLLTLPCVALLSHGYPEFFYRPVSYWTLLVLLGVLAFNYVTTHSGLAALQARGLPELPLAMLNGVALLATFALVVVETLANRRNAPWQRSGGRAT